MAAQTTDMDSADPTSDVQRQSPAKQPMVRTLGSLLFQATWSQRDHPTTLKILREAVVLTEEFLRILEKELGLGSRSDGASINGSKEEETAGSLPKLLMDAVGVRTKGRRRIELLRDLRVTLRKEVSEARREIKRLEHLLEGKHTRRRRRRKGDKAQEQGDSVKNSEKGSRASASSSRHMHVTRASTGSSQRSKAMHKMSGALPVEDAVESGHQKLPVSKLTRSSQAKVEKEIAPRDSVRAWLGAVAASEGQVSPRSRSVDPGLRKESEEKVKADNSAGKASRASSKQSGNREAAPSRATSKESATAAQEDEKADVERSSHYTKTSSRRVDDKAATGGSIPSRHTGTSKATSNSPHGVNDKTSTRTKTSKIRSISSKTSRHTKSPKPNLQSSADRPHEVEKASTRSRSSSIPSKTSSEHAIVSSSKAVGDETHQREGSSRHSAKSVQAKDEKAESAPSISKSSSARDSAIPLHEDEAERTPVRSQSLRSNSISSRTSSERATVSSSKHLPDSRRSSKITHAGEVGGASSPDKKGDSASPSREVLEVKGTSTSRTNSRTSTEHATVSSSKHSRNSRRSSKSTTAAEMPS